MGDWCLKKSDYTGGGVLSENRLLTFDRYIKWNVPVIKISNLNLPVFLLCEIQICINLFILCENKTRQSCFPCL